MPAESQAQRAYLYATKGSGWVHAHGFANKGKLPAHAAKQPRNDPLTQALARRTK